MSDPVGFHDVLFPTNISYGSIGGPEFSTDVRETDGGRERRNVRWRYPRERWDVAYGVTEEEYLSDLNEFFMARMGMGYSFRFKNHNDFQARDRHALPEASSGDPGAYQLVKAYEVGSYELLRKITKPIDGTLTVWLDDAVQTSGFTCDYATGILEFTSPPSSSQVVEAEFDFHIEARFDTDYLAINLDQIRARSAQVPVLEVRR